MLRAKKRKLLNEQEGTSAAVGGFVGRRGQDVDSTYFGPLLKRTQSKKELVIITDLLGRPTKEIKNQLLFYIYSDGTVEKRLIKN